MVGCSALGCRNRSDNGFHMKRFPRDPIRRKAWADQVNRVGWYPTIHATLCEIHFEPCMWEKTRVDGTRKLRISAIPTIFSNNFQKLKEKTTSTTDPLPSCNMKDVELEVDCLPTSILRNVFDTVSLVDISKIPLVVVSESTCSPLEDSTKYGETKITDGENMITTCTKLIDHKANKRKFTLKNIHKNELGHSSTIKMLEKHFNVDMIEAIIGTSIKWCNVAIENALKLKYTYGINSYKEVSNKLTMPSLKALEEHLLNMNLGGGILNEVFPILKLKVSCFTSDNHKDCAIFFKEIPITSADIYNAAVDKDSCNMTINKHAGIATHVLIVIVAGICVSWEQIIAFYFTGNYVNTFLYKNILLEVINKTEQLGLKVISITSDIDLSRQALWENWKITAEDDAIIKNYVTHPFDSLRKLYLLFDVTSLFKNIKNMITGNKNITIPNHIQQGHNLLNNIAESGDIDDLVSFQDALNFRLVPTLMQEDLTPKNFRTITLSSPNIVKYDVISGLNFLANELNKPKYKTTSWFIETVEKWFTVMTTSTPTTESNIQNINIYNENVLFLREFIQLFSQLQINGKDWKPYTQILVILCTQSILDIQNIFLNQKGYGFIPISRLTQHYFKKLHGLGADAIEIKSSLKSICISQLLLDVPTNL